MSTVLDVLKEHGVDLHPTGNPDEWILTCPETHCGKRKLYLNIEKRLFTCFVCSQSGGVRKLFKLLGINSKSELSPSFETLRQKAAEQIAKRSRVDLVPESDGTCPLPPEFKVIDPFASPTATSEATRAYLNGRGVTDDQIRYWSIGCCETGKYAGFCVIPITDHLGSVVSFQARRVAGMGQKSLNPPGGDKFLFNIDHAKASPGLVLVEGPFDAMAVHFRMLEGGLPISSVALLGHSCSSEQAMMISRILRPELVWIALDPDITNIDMHKVGAVLRMNGCRDVRVALLPRDPDEMEFVELADCLDTAEPALILRKS